MIRILCRRELVSVLICLLFVSQVQCSSTYYPYDHLSKVEIVSVEIGRRVHRAYSIEHLSKMEDAFRASVRDADSLDMFSHIIRGVKWEDTTYILDPRVLCFIYRDSGIDTLSIGYTSMSLNSSYVKAVDADLLGFLRGIVPAEQKESIDLYLQNNSAD